MESVNVNFNPEGASFYHNTSSGKAPVSLTVDLQFKELLIAEREDIDKTGVYKQQATGTFQIDQGGQEF